jgi:hypothetical protein
LVSCFFDAPLATGIVFTANFLLSDATEISD